MLFSAVQWDFICVLKTMVTCLVCFGFFLGQQKGLGIVRGWGSGSMGMRGSKSCQFNSLLTFIFEIIHFTAQYRGKALGKQSGSTDVYKWLLEEPPINTSQSSSQSAPSLGPSRAAPDLSSLLGQPSLTHPSQSPLVLFNSSFLMRKDATGR